MSIQKRQTGELVEAVAKSGTDLDAHRGIHDRLCLYLILCAGFKVSGPDSGNKLLVIFQQPIHRHIIDREAAFFPDRLSQVDRETCIVELSVVVLHAAE